MKAIAGIGQPGESYLGSSARVVSQELAGLAAIPWSQPKRCRDGLFGTGGLARAAHQEMEDRRWGRYATPILVGRHLYVFTRESEREVLRAVDAETGSVLWKTPGVSRTSHREVSGPAHGAGPKSTPTFADGRLFTLGMAGTVTAFDAATGKQLWQRPPDAIQPQWLTAASPLVNRGLVIVHVGGDNHGAL